MTSRCHQSLMICPIFNPLTSSLYLDSTSWTKTGGHW